jgi:hypothetical protein
MAGSMAREVGRIYESLRGAELKSQAQRQVTRLPDTRIESLVQSAGLPEKYAQALVGTGTIGRRRKDRESPEKRLVVRFPYATHFGERNVLILLGRCPR